MFKRFAISTALGLLMTTQSFAGDITVEGVWRVPQQGWPVQVLPL